MMKVGSKLHPEDQKHVLAAYIYRHTGDHVPPIVKGVAKLQFKNDQDWLEHTSFKVNKDGRLDKRAKYCYPELRK